MTFFVKRDEVQPSAKHYKDMPLSQRGRAGMDILGSMQVFSSSTLRDTWKDRFEANPEVAELDQMDTSGMDRASLRDRLVRGRTIAESDQYYRLERFIQRYVAEENFNRGIPSVEEKRDMFATFGAPPSGEPKGSLDLNEAYQAPAYTTTEWHLEPGGWDGYDLYPAMFAHAVGPRVFARGGYAYAMVGEDIRKHRMFFVDQFPRSSYERIVELGCGACTTLMTVGRAYPDAELAGYDTSPTLLKTGHSSAELQGMKIDLKRESADDVSEPDNNCDLVYSYALHHEIPNSVSEKVLREAFRILKPGGDFIMSDLPPFRAVPSFNGVLMDWESAHRGEPFFTQAALMDLDQTMRDIGFVDVESYGMGEHAYPWITKGRKPE
ncbi:class I SAM-dependent methyltransferase [Ponticaulis profundi]|uniref:Class I SAM-dependent methyltransferase n=1 Tax=Ponticaulis profundi TaxID=2665222 RepID=A0ABW1SAF8_9PROT